MALFYYSTALNGMKVVNALLLVFAIIFLGVGGGGVKSGTPSLPFSTTRVLAPPRLEIVS